MLIRSFIALKLPEYYQDGLSGVRRLGQRSLRSKITWTRPGNWHLTLFFLGDQPAHVLDRLKEELGRIKAPSFVLQAGKPGFFYGPRGPRVVWLGLEQGRKNCVALAEKVALACQGVGLPQEKRPFRPHLTLARIKWVDKGDDWSVFLNHLATLEWPEFEVSSFVLWKSVLHPQGPIYTRLAEFGLD